MKPLFASISLLICLPLMIRADTSYTTSSCSTNKTDAYCAKQNIPYSCCATVTQYSLSSGKTSLAVNYYCMPYDIVKAIPLIIYDTSTNYTYDCPSTSILPSDTCSSASTACATLSNSCCATRTLKIEANDFSSKVSALCLLQSDAGNYTISGAIKGTNMAFSNTCKSPLTYSDNDSGLIGVCMKYIGLILMGAIAFLIY